MPLSWITSLPLPASRKFSLGEHFHSAGNIDYVCGPGLYSNASAFALTSANAAFAFALAFECPEVGAFAFALAFES